MLQQLLRYHHHGLCVDDWFAQEAVGAWHDRKLDTPPAPDERTIMWAVQQQQVLVIPGKHQQMKVVRHQVGWVSGSSGACMREVAITCQRHACMRVSQQVVSCQACIVSSFGHGISCDAANLWTGCQHFCKHCHGEQ
jgi:hypothetical protein